MSRIKLLCHSAIVQLREPFLEHDKTDLQTGYALAMLVAVFHERGEYLYTQFMHSTKWVGRLIVITRAVRDFWAAA